MLTDHLWITTESNSQSNVTYAHRPSLNNYWMTVKVVQPCLCEMQLRSLFWCSFLWWIQTHTTNNCKLDYIYLVTVSSFLCFPLQCHCPTCCKWLAELLESNKLCNFVKLPFRSLKIWNSVPGNEPHTHTHITILTCSISSICSHRRRRLFPSADLQSLPCVEVLAWPLYGKCTCGFPGKCPDWMHQLPPLLPTLPNWSGSGYKRRPRR